MPDTIFIKTIRLIVASFCLLISFFNLFGCSTVNKATKTSNKSDTEETRLKIKIKAGESHHYSIHLNAGEFAHIKVEQYGIDIIAKVSSANSEDSNIFDSPSGELDAENIYL